MALKRISALAWGFLSGWWRMARERYAFLISSLDALEATPRMLYRFSNRVSCGQAILPFNHGGGYFDVRALPHKHSAAQQTLRLDTTARDGDDLVPGLRALFEFDLARCHVERGRDELEQGLVGTALDGRRGEAQLQRLAV